MADGRLLYLAFAPTRYNGQDVLICAFSDISARKQIEVTLERARQLADRANEAKTLFLATMSHEIRTPLYGVLGTLELLARTYLNDQQNNYLNDQDEHPRATTLEQLAQMKPAFKKDGAHATKWQFVCTVQAQGSGRTSLPTPT